MIQHASTHERAQVSTEEYLYSFNRNNSKNIQTVVRKVGFLAMTGIETLEVLDEKQKRNTLEAHNHGIIRRPLQCVGQNYNETQQLNIYISARRHR